MDPSVKGTAAITELETQRASSVDGPGRSGRAGDRPSRGLVALAALGLVGAGAVGMWLYMRFVPHRASPPAPVFSPISTEIQTRADEIIEVVLPPEALGRANLKTAPVLSRRLAQTVRVPGVVQANAYQEVKVTPLVGGVVTKTFAKLGDAVRRGRPLATIFSAELSEAQTHFLTMKAELEAEEKKLKRTEELRAIGAASREELEAVQATHAVHQAHVRAARQRLLLLGLSEEQVARLTDAQQITSDVAVPAPIDGLVVSRTVNSGQVVAMGQEMFTVADLSTVWVIGDLFEKDFSAVRIGAKAAITTPAYPGRIYRGMVSYIDPRMDPQTRTAKVRMEVVNPGLALKIGMYGDVSIVTAEGPMAPVVSGGAIPSLGSHPVVYLPAEGDNSRFIQRTVKLGEAIDGVYQVLEGLKPGEKVITEGSFLLKAESLRQHPVQ